MRLIADQMSPGSNHQYSDIPLVSNVVGHDGDFLAAQLQQSSEWSPRGTVPPNSR